MSSFPPLFVLFCVCVCKMNDASCEAASQPSMFDMTQKRPLCMSVCTESAPG